MSNTPLSRRGTVKNEQDVYPIGTKAKDQFQLNGEIFKRFLEHFENKAKETTQIYKRPMVKISTPTITTFPRIKNDGSR